MKLVFSVICASLCLASTALAKQVKMDFDYEYAIVHGDETVISLKARAAERIDANELAHAMLAKVTITAKTRFGWGSVALRVDGVESESVRVTGNPDDFDNPLFTTFDRVAILSPAIGANSDWQLVLRGKSHDDFVLRRVVIEIDVPNPFVCTSQDVMMDGLCVHAIPMYAFYSMQTGDHFYSPDPVSPGGDYVLQGRAFALPVSSYQVNGVLPFYRLYNGSVQDHFYTADRVEMEKALEALHYGYEDTYQIFDVQKPGTIPLARFYNPATGDHLYKTDTNPVAGYSMEMNVGFVFP